MSDVAAAKPGLISMVRTSFGAMTRTERHRTLGMYGSILLLHALGFAVCIAYVLPAHYKLFGVGLSVTAYTLGLRHAFDADHISAIDNTTRKTMNQRQGTDKPRPLAFGYFFSLGHSTIVVAIGVGIIVAEKAVLPAVTHSNSSLESFGGSFGTIVSAGFLFLIALLNLVILAGIVRVWRAMRRGEYDEAELESQLEKRGFFYRFFGRWMNAIDKEWQMYPVGVVFGMGFDTATEVALLGISATQAAKGASIWMIMVFPALFAAGMSLIDTTDGVLMLGAYDWAFVKPIRKLFYNMTITLVSVIIALLIGGIEALGLLQDQLHLSGEFWDWVTRLNGNFNGLGFAIIGIFIVTWAASVMIYRYKGYEQLEVRSSGD